jgi:hypothetical protein
MRRFFNKKFLMIAISLFITSCSTANPSFERPVSSMGTGGRPILTTGNDERGKVIAVLWSDAENGYVHIEKAVDAQEPNNHPIAFTSEQIQLALSELQFQQGEKKPKPLFTEGELKDISGPIAEGLARAEPNQDITFAATGRPGGVLNLLTERSVTTGRVFYKDDQLNIVFGLIREPFEDQFRATGVLRPFTPGSRQAPLETTSLTVLPVKGVDYAAAGRTDWIQMAPYAWSEKPVEDKLPSGIPAAPVADASSAASPASARTATAASAVSAPSSVGAAPVVTRPPAAPERSTVTSPSTVASRASGSSSAGSSAGATESEEAYYGRFEARLKTLRKLREEGLISEQEYQQKRRAILDEL